METTEPARKRHWTWSDRKITKQLMENRIWRHVIISIGLLSEIDLQQSRFSERADSRVNMINTVQSVGWSPFFSASLPGALNEIRWHRPDSRRREIARGSIVREVLTSVSKLPIHFKRIGWRDSLYPSITW